jgi:hypothetical protein
VLRYYRNALETNRCTTGEIGSAEGELSIAGGPQLPFECPEGEGSVIAPPDGGRFFISWSG